MESSHERPNIRLVKPDAVERSEAGLSHQIESLPKIAHELPPLFSRHWQELGSYHKEIPLDPDWDRYFLLAEDTSLRIRTARFDGVLAGYIFNLLGPHLHYRSTMHANIEMFWLDPAYRLGRPWFAMEWFRANDEALREAGVKRVSVAVKSGYRGGRVGLIFKRLGYLPHEQVWSKIWAR